MTRHYITPKVGLKAVFLGKVDKPVTEALTKYQLGWKDQPILIKDRAAIYASYKGTYVADFGDGTLLYFTNVTKPELQRTTCSVKIIPDSPDKVLVSFNSKLPIEEELLKNMLNHLIDSFQEKTGISELSSTEKDIESML